MNRPGTQRGSGATPCNRRFEAGDGTRARFRADLGANLTFADSFFEERFKRLCDTFADRVGESVPDDEIDQFPHDPPEITELDLAAEGISTVLWTSGYRPAFGWIELPVLSPPTGSTG